MDNFTITVNGEKQEINQVESLIELLAKLKIDPAEVFVELNGKILTDQNLTAVKLKDEDCLEIVHFVGGG